MFAFLNDMLRIWMNGRDDGARSPFGDTLSQGFNLMKKALNFSVS